MHPYFHLFGLSIPAYWLFALLGVLAAGAYCAIISRRGARGHVPGLHLLYIGLYSVIGAMLGGRLLYRIVSLAAGQPAQGLFSQGGMVYYGGLLARCWL